MRPASMLHIKAHNDLWEARQDFIKLGKYPVTVRAVGLSRSDALKGFETMKAWEEEPQEDGWQFLCDWLWTLAGRVDSLMQFLTCIKALFSRAK